MKKLTCLSLTIVSAAGTYMDSGLWIEDIGFADLSNFKLSKVLTSKGGKREWEEWSKAHPTYSLKMTPILTLYMIKKFKIVYNVKLSAIKL